MFIGRPTFDELRYTRGGTMNGDYDFVGSVSMSRDTPIQDERDAQNKLTFKTNQIEVSKDLVVLGTLNAPNWGDKAEYPTEPTFTNINVTQTVNTDNVQAQNVTSVNVTAETIKGDVEAGTVSAEGAIIGEELMSQSSISGTSMIISGTITGNTIEGMQKVHAPIVEATTVKGDIESEKIQSDEATITKLNSDEATIALANISTLSAPAISSDTLVTTNKISSKHIEMKHGNWELDIWPGSLHMRNQDIFTLSNILLDSATGKITCNGGLDCSNDNHPFDIINAKGLTADYVTTKNHKSTFGTQLLNPFTTYGISIEAAGTITAPKIAIPGSVYGTWGGMDSGSVWHSVELTAPKVASNSLINSDGDNSMTQIDMAGHDIDMKVSGTNVCTFNSSGTKFTHKVDFTGLNADDIVNWPLTSELNHIEDTDTGVKVLQNAGEDALGNMLCRGIVAAEIQTGSVTASELDTTNANVHKLKALDSVNADTWLALSDIQLGKYESDALLLGPPKTEQKNSMQIKITQHAEPSLEIIADSEDVETKPILAKPNIIHLHYKELQPPEPTPTPQPTPTPPQDHPADQAAAASISTTGIALFPHTSDNGGYDSHYFSPVKQYSLYVDPLKMDYKFVETTPKEYTHQQVADDYKVEQKESFDGYHRSNHIKSFKGDLRRHLAQRHDFMDDNGTVTSFQLQNDQTQTLHLTHEQLESLEGVTGSALFNLLKSNRNTRSIIKGELATFGLHTNEEGAGDVHLLLMQDQPTDPSYVAVSVDRQIYKVSNKEVISGAYVVDWTGYNGDLKEHVGARIAVNNQTSLGRVYLGRWDRSLPNNDANDDPNDFADVNLQGSVRFSGVPDNFNSGLRYAALDHDGLQIDNIKPLTTGLTIAGDVTFTGDVHGIDLSDKLPSLSENQSGVWSTKPVYTSQVGLPSAHTIYDNKIRMHMDGSNVVEHYKLNNALHSEFYSTVVHHNNAYFADQDGAPVIQFTRETGQIDCNAIGATAGPVKWEMGVNHIQATISEMPKFLIMPDAMYGYVPWVQRKTGSSANYTHCHCFEPTFQNQDWENRVGLAVVSSGVYQSRDDSGASVSDVANPPGNEYATTQVELAQEGDILGIVSSVELVQDQKILHRHGGIGIDTPVSEQDGHKVIRVAGSGDIFAWVAKPSLADCPMPVLSGAYEKYVAGVHKGTVYGLEHNGVLHLDSWEGTWSGRSHTLGEGEQKEIALTEDELCIKFNVTQSSQLTAELLSGAYTKTVNGVQQPTQIIMNVNPDMSFTWSENTPSLESRIAALETAWLEFTGPD